MTVYTGFSSEIGTKLRDWAVGQAGGQLLLLGSVVLKWTKDAVEIDKSLNQAFKEVQMSYFFFNFLYLTTWQNKLNKKPYIDLSDCTGPNIYVCPLYFNLIHQSPVLFYVQEEW